MLLPTDQQVCRIVAFRLGAVDHVPVVTDEHTLLEQCRIGTGVAELPPEPVAHVVDLAARFNVRIVAGRPASTGKACPGSKLERSIVERSRLKSKEKRAEGIVISQSCFFTMLRACENFEIQYVIFQSIRFDRVTAMSRRYILLHLKLSQSLADAIGAIVKSFFFLMLNALAGVKAN